MLYLAHEIWLPLRARERSRGVTIERIGFNRMDSISPDASSKQCIKCKEWKSRDDFYDAAKQKQKPPEERKKATTCKSCRNAESAQWMHEHIERKRINDCLYRLAHPERNKNTYRWKLKWKYGLTQAEYDAMLAEQGGVCAICKRSETKISINGTIQGLCVDHNHETGKVRALLCDECNKHPARIEYPPAAEKPFMDYLQRYQ